MYFSYVLNEMSFALKRGYQVSLIFFTSSKSTAMLNCVLCFADSYTEHNLDTFIFVKFKLYYK